MDKNDPLVREFVGYWRLSEEMATKASHSGFLGYVSTG
jgi:hypothetical protein